MKSQSVVYRYRTDFNRYYLFTLKTSAGTAWKNQPVGRDWKPDFFCCNGAIIFSENGMNHVRQNGRLQTCRIGINKEEKRIVRQNLAA